MEETTHDSSSSSRKSEEKCPPAGGIKMKIGGFKDRPLLPQTIRCSNPTGTQWG